MKKKRIALVAIGIVVFLLAVNFFVNGFEFSIYGVCSFNSKYYDSPKIAFEQNAITATKAYHKKNSPLGAIEEIKANSINHLDPYICDIFINNIIEYYNGREIRLSNEQVGSIVRIDPVKITKPVIRCENDYHDLSVEKDLEIVEFL